ncbi:type II toxin-antitoxin system HicA family toxin [Endozoicomonas numazuensis]|uniref:type II toxin-antitoxin system HicA family toxin n=1 Tax=Endozoicomonas numazuensis TaxID=1137799 RepID=UPI001F36331B|nr:type II toxin-antitoxin system HicA family toxin [Endozoicomonas numazuensis]
MRDYPNKAVFGVIPTYDIIYYNIIYERKTPENACSNIQRSVPKQLEWKAIEALLTAVGAEIIEGRGSRVRFHKHGGIGTFHRPHPKKEAKPYQVKDARDFLIRIGVKP